MAERPTSTAEQLNNDLSRWEKAKLAASSIVLIGLTALTSEMIAGVKTSSEQVQAAMQLSMIVAGVISSFSIVAAIEFSRRGDKTIRNAQRLGIKSQDRFFRRRLITPDQRAV